MKKQTHAQSTQQAFKLGATKTQRGFSRGKSENTVYNFLANTENACEKRGCPHSLLSCLACQCSRVSGASGRTRERLCSRALHRTHTPCTASTSTHSGQVQTRRVAFTQRRRPHLGTATHQRKEGGQKNRGPKRNTSRNARATAAVPSVVFLLHSLTPPPHLPTAVIQPHLRRCPSPCRRRCHAQTPPRPGPRVPRRRWSHWRQRQARHRGLGSSTLSQGPRTAPDRAAARCQRCGHPHRDRSCRAGQRTWRGASQAWRGDRCCHPSRRHQARRS